MAEFGVEVFQNQYLPEGSTDVHAVVAVECSGAGVAGSAGGAAEIVIIDTSGSMENPSSKIGSARQAGAVAVDEIVDGTEFAVIAGTDTARVAYPHHGGLAVANAHTREEAKTAIRAMQTGGGTAIGSWLRLAGDLFRESGAAQHHAILLTDGQNQSEDRWQLDGAIRQVEGVFQCDCRGVGQDWSVDELRAVSSALLGTVDLIARPADMEADFEKMMRSAMSRGVPDVRLRVWAPQGSTVTFARQVSPTIEDLSAKARRVSDLVVEFPTGAWGDEQREFHVAVQVPVQTVGQERLAGRVQIVVGDQVVGQGLVKAVWSDDVALTTRINPTVAHYTGQAELAQAIQEGLAAKAEGRDAEATAKLGRAVQLAASTGNEEATSRLRKVVDVQDEETGTVRLKRDVAKLDEMALDTASTKTTRVK